VPVRVREIKAPAAVICIDLARSGMSRIRIKLDAPFLEPRPDLVKLLLTHQEGKMLRSDLSVDLIKIDGHAVCQLHHLKMIELTRRGQAKYLRQKFRRAIFIGAPGNGVV